MKLLLLAVGKRHDRDIAEAIDDYTARLQRYCRAEWQFVPSAQASMSPAEQRVYESRTLRARLKPGDTVVLLDERGEQATNQRVADLFAGYEQIGAERVVCVIGGAFGVDDELRARADYTWALSRLVLPHQLVRVVLAEQLYRTFTILRGEPYHHQ